jgi:hypothetical protein
MTLKVKNSLRSKHRKFPIFGRFGLKVIVDLLDGCSVLITLSLVVIPYS